MMNTEGKRFSSKDPVRAITNMHDRGNGLGGGFAVYGIYPDFKDYYAFHIMYLSKDAKEKTDRILASKFDIIYDEEMQTKPANVHNPPLVWRYFVQPKKIDLKTKRRRLRHRRCHANQHGNWEGVCLLKRQRHGCIQRRRFP